MKYLFLVYGDASLGEIISASERDVFDKACLVNDEALRENGYLLAAMRLQNENAVTTVRIKNGNLSLTNGPFIETEEQLIALFFINARDLNEAVRVASKMPQAGRGLIEVWSVVEFD